MVNQIIGKISKGSRMDQIYISKNRSGFSSGDYVLITPISPNQMQEQQNQFKPFFYGIQNLEPVKLQIIEKIFNILKEVSPDNIILTGSFLEKGFRFNDIDILLVKEKETNIKSIENKIENLTGIKTHIIQLDNTSLIYGLSSDPLYNLMLSKCISEKRIIFKVQRKINYKILDLHLLKSKTLTDNFDILSGNEKYYFTLNMISILLFIQNKKLSRETVNREIEKIFGIKLEELKENLLSKQEFMKKYKEIYNKTFNLIMENIK